MFELLPNVRRRIIDKITIIPHDSKHLHIPMDYLEEKLSFIPLTAEMYLDRENTCVGYRFLAIQDCGHNYRVFKHYNCYVLNLSTALRALDLPTKVMGTHHPEYFWDKAMLVIKLDCLIK
jgi:hypothetical protein